MKVFKRPRHGSRSGWAMLMVGLALFAGSTMTAVLLVSSNVTSKRATQHRQQTRAWYLAEGAIEVAKNEILTAVANFEPVPAAGDVVIDGRTVTYAIAPTLFEETVADDAGIQTMLTGYRIDATALVEGHRATAHRIINIEATPLFQFAVFYNDDLEIFPGPNMTVGGRVHTNGDMYLGSDNTLTIDTNYLRAIGDIRRSRKDDPSASPGTVSVRRWVQNPYDGSEPAEFVEMLGEAGMSAAGIATVSGYDSLFAGWDGAEDGDYDDAGDWLPWSAGALELWSEPVGYAGGSGSTVKSAIHGTSEAVPPSVSSIAMFEPNEDGTGNYDFDPDLGIYVPVAAGDGAFDKGHYHESAGLSIITHEDGSWFAYDGAGNDVSALVAPAIDVTEMLDVRQSEGSGEKIQVTEIDVEALNASGVFPPNGLLYAAAYGAGDGVDAKGVVLTNGPELLAPLTVATEGPIYVHGDYNVTGKKGAAVIADAINLLSNAWTGTKTVGSLPAASQTTFNLAFATGNMPTEGDAYNGGLENLPRFHESWSGVKCFLNGSFVNIWDSVQATGSWVYGGSYYTAPKRNFSYDEDFNDVANLPPFTPMALSAAEVVSW